MGKNSSVEPQRMVHRDELGIVTCVYTPQMPKSGFSDYVSPAAQAEPVAAQGNCFASSAVLPLDPATEQNWNALVAAATAQGGEAAGAGGTLKQHFEALMQTIAEGGQEMLPLIRSLREKADGDPRLADIVDTLQERLGAMGEPATCHLAPRELEVIELAAEGRSNAEIAERLELQVITVGKALTRAYRKLGAKNRSEAVHKWMLLRDLGR